MIFLGKLWNFIGQCDLFLRPQDKLVILSHIERSEKNKQFLLKSVNQCQLPVDLVLITQSRTGLGGKCAVLQALLGYQQISRACLLDDNIQVLGELDTLSGLALHVVLYIHRFMFSLI